MKLKNLKNQRTFISSMDAFFYNAFDESLSDTQLDKLLNVVEEAKPGITKLIELSNIEPKYNKDVLIAYLGFKQKILKCEIELMDTLTVG